MIIYWFEVNECTYEWRQSRNWSSCSTWGLIWSEWRHSDDLVWWKNLSSCFLFRGSFLDEEVPSRCFVAVTFGLRLIFNTSNPRSAKYKLSKVKRKMRHVVPDEHLDLDLTILLIQIRFKDTKLNSTFLVIFICKQREL